MKRLLVFLGLACGLYAAIPADAVWQVQTMSSADTNGGCWVNSQKGATGVDHSQGAGTAFTSSLSAVGTTTLTDSGMGFLNTMLGNCINIVGQGTYVIEGFTSSAIVTVDRSLGTFSTTGGQEGGPNLSLGHVCGTATSGNTAYFKADGTFSITSASTNVNAGTCSPALTALLLVGYTSNRTIYNTDAAPTLQLNVSTATMFNTSNAPVTVFNFILDGNSQTSSKAHAAGVEFIKVAFKNFNTASTSSPNNFYYNVSVTTSSAAVIAGTCFFCEAYANTATPIAFGAVGYCVFCLSYSNTGATTDGIIFNDSAGTIGCFFCTAYANGRDGIRAINNNRNNIIVNSYSESNTGDGFNIGGSTNSTVLIGYGYYNNGTNLVSNATTIKSTAISASSSALVSATNLAPNATANAGALIRNVAIPAQFLRGLTASYLDVGGVRHQDPASVTVGVPSIQ